MSPLHLASIIAFFLGCASRRWFAQIWFLVYGSLGLATFFVTLLIWFGFEKNEKSRCSLIWSFLLFLNLIYAICIFPQFFEGPWCHTDVIYIMALMTNLVFLHVEVAGLISVGRGHSRSASTQETNSVNPATQVDNHSTSDLYPFPFPSKFWAIPREEYRDVRDNRFQEDIR